MPSWEPDLSKFQSNRRNTFGDQRLGVFIFKICWNSCFLIMREKCMWRVFTIFYCQSKSGSTN